METSKLITFQESYLKKLPAIWVSALLTVTFSMGQCYEIRDIIDSKGDNPTKFKQLQSFIGKSKSSSIEKNALGDCYHDYANRWFFERWLENKRKSNLDSAIYYTKKAIKSKTELDVIDENSLKKSTYNLAFFYLCSQDFFEAIKYYLSVLELGKRDLKTQFATNDLALCYETIGDFEKARQHYLSVVEFYSSQNALSNRALIAADLGLINLYNRMEREVLNTEIEKILVSSDSTFRAEGITKGFQLGQYYVGKAIYFFNLEEFDNARAFYSKALRVETGFNDFQNATIYNNLGLCELERGHLKTSQENALKAIQLSSAFSGPYETLGHVFVEKKDFAKSMRYYQQAINLVMGKTTSIDTIDLPTREELALTADKLHLLNHLIAKANGWIKYYEHDSNKEHLAHALETFTLADQLVDLIRFESTEQQSKLYWREQGANLYMKAVEACYLLEKPERAYYFMERNKALLLLEDLTNEEAKEIAQLPDKVAEREFILKRAIHLAENNLQETGNENNDIIASWKDSVRDSKYRYEQFVDSLNESFPDYAKFKKKVDVLAFEDLKTNFVSKDRAVLHYILNDEQGYGLLTSASTTLLFKLENTSKLNWDVEVLIHMLSSGNSNQETFNSLAYTLFQNLFPKKVHNELKAKELTIVPDYTLQRIPFETLVVDETTPKYLIEDVDISYAYSASLLDYSKRMERYPPDEFLGLAPIQFTELGLPQLYFSENEIKGIANVLPGRTLLNRKASKSSFIENVNQHKIVHLATHADIGDGENPWIAFSDSKMYLKEIYATKNQADMVVLSGCNTSNGELKRGEGVMSLARGFFYSGAKSVVSSLWPIEDEAGKDILIAFYKNLGRGDSKSKALRKAKLAYLNTTQEAELKHPFYWAGFVVLGDNAPVVQAFNWFWIFLVVALVVGAVLIFRFRSIKLFQ